MFWILQYDFIFKLEKTHEIHAQFEEEFSRRNQETAQVVGQHQELMECLNEESEAKNQLALKLHKAEGKETKLIPQFQVSFVFYMLI